MSSQPEPPGPNEPSPPARQTWKQTDDAIGRARSRNGVPQTLYPDVITWVEVHFLPMYRRPLGGEFRWCSRWFDHAEAISRLTALWHSWEALRLQSGVGLGLWYRDHLDHQLPYLMGARGPFYQCSEDKHYEPRLAKALPVPLHRKATIGKSTREMA